MSQTHTSNPRSGSAGDRASAAADTAKEQMGSAADAARSQAADVAAATGEQVRAVADDAKHEARRLFDDSRQHLMSQASDQTKKLAGSVREVSSQLDGMASGSRAPEGLVGDITQQAAGATARLADRLESSEPDELVDEVRRFARRRPGMFLLGAMGAGFVVGRLFRTTDTQRLVDVAKSGAQSDGHGRRDVSGDGGARHLAGGSTTPTQPLPTATAEFPEQLTPAVRP